MDMHVTLIELFLKLSFRLIEVNDGHDAFWRINANELPWRIRDAYVLVTWSRKAWNVPYVINAPVLLPSRR